MKTCEACGDLFPARMIIDGTLRYLYKRRFCLQCSPFGVHNTSKTPPGTMTEAELREHRRRQRNATIYRYHKRRRKALKIELVASAGGRCVDCGYDAEPKALDFHHPDASAKEFAISDFNGSYRRLLAEAAKCDLLCANCHRIRHAAEDAKHEERDPVVGMRRALKIRAVEAMGASCQACGRTGPSAMFEFHHRDANAKDFGISQDGIPRRWEVIATELAKCVMLCANCHREVHTGVRTITQSGLAEDASLYAA